MDEADAVTLVRRGYEAFQKGNIEALLALLAEDVEWELPAVEGLPWTGNRRGKQAVTEFFGTLAEHEEVQTFEPQEYIAQGDKVAVVGHYSAKVKATGRIAESPWVHVFTIRDGKVAKLREIFDTASVARAYQ